MDAVTEFPRRSTSRFTNTHRTAPNARDSSPRSPNWPTTPSTCRTSSAGTHRMGGGERIDVVAAAPPRREAGHLTNAEHSDATAAIDAAMAAKDAWARHPVRRARRGVPAGRRPAGRAVAREALRGDDARPVQVRLPGRDRRGRASSSTSGDSTCLRPTDPGGAADLAPAACGTASTTGRWRGSSTRSPRSTSPRSRATCRPRRR